MTWEPLDIRAALSGPPPIIDYVLPNLPVGTTGILCGPGGVGKTTAVTQLAVELAIGAPLLGGLFPSHPPGKVLLVLAEEPPELMAQRLQDAASLSRNGFALDAHEQDELRERLTTHLKLFPLSGHNVSILTGGETTCRLDELHQLANGCRLVVVDPLRRFHDGDENNSGEMTRLIQAFEGVARATHAAFIVVHHATKASATNGNGDAQQSARGSSALTDAVRWQANLSAMTAEEARLYRVSDEERFGYVRFSLVKCNYGPLTAAWLRRLKGGVLVPTTLSSRSANQRASYKRDLPHD